MSAAVACGESPLGYTEIPMQRQRSKLWLVGNRRSDTLRYSPRPTHCGCGLWGIAARIHCGIHHGQHIVAVACGESPLGYTGYNYASGRLDAVACGESPLGYTQSPPFDLHGYAVACGESPLGYTFSVQHERYIVLWLVGNRRSDTLGRWCTSDCPCCGLWGIAARIHCRGKACCSRPRCGLWGIAARIHLYALVLTPYSCCGLWGIAARIHYRRCAASSVCCCGLWGIAARIHCSRQG